jgi:hypothetical protein
VNDFIGVNIARSNDGKISLTQPKLIQSILDDLGVKEDTKQRQLQQWQAKFFNNIWTVLPLMSPGIIVV